MKETRQGEAELVYLILFSDILLFTTKKEREEGQGHRFIVHRVDSLGGVRAEDQELGNGMKNEKKNKSDTLSMLDQSYNII